MNSSKLKENICRICLKLNANLNWNEVLLGFCGVSYKDCYYKYTKLEQNDSDSYPTNLCEKCAEDLKKAHILFEKALESFEILQDLDMQCFDINLANCSQSKIKHVIQSSDVVDVLGETEENYNFLTPDTNEICSESESASHVLQRNKMTEVSTVDSTHFIDIHTLESSVEIPFEENFAELCNTEVKKSLTARRKRNPVDKISPASTEYNAALDTSSFNNKKKRKRNKCDALFVDTSCKKASENNTNCDTEIKEVELKDVSSLENLDANSTKSTKKSSEKYLLMCSYCSLKVKGPKKLAQHEARHSENRERTVICPECGLKLYTDMSLTLHMQTHDKHRQKNHKCEFCEKSFFNKGGLNIHRRIHLGLMLKCQICEKEFFRQVDLDKHLLTHSVSPLAKNVERKKNTAQCQYCNKSILTDALKEHIAIHLNQPLMKCKICDKNFYSRANCTKHLRRVHSKTLIEYEDCIHYYVDRNKRLSTLMIKQQLVEQALK